MPDTNSQATDFTATIDWGDGNSDQAQVTGGNGSFTVTDDHVYTTPGSFTVTVSITDSTGGNADASAQAAATVADSLAASGGGLTGGFVEPAIVKQSASLTLATLESSDLTPSDFTVQIDWGDGSTPSPITLSAAQDGMYQIGGTHTYLADGTYTATITVADSLGTTASTTSTVNVGDIYAGIPAQLKVGSFTAPDPTTTYTATVAWGDGGSSAATVTETNGAVTIIGTHTYALAGPFQPTITVTPAGAAPITANAPPVQVINAPITIYANDTDATTGNILLATFTDPNPLDTVANFAATVIWGLGTSTSATVTGGNGLFLIFGACTSALGPVLAPQLQLNENQNLVAAAQPVVVAEQMVSQLIGPRVVPGNSKYRFTLTTPPDVEVTNRDCWLVNAATLRGLSQSIGYWNTNFTETPPNGPKTSGVDVTFLNVPANVIVNLSFELNGVGFHRRFEVTIVAVLVDQADDGSYFTANTSFASRTTTGGSVALTTASSFNRNNRSPGLSWTAPITLAAPNNPVVPNPLAQIQAGFVQHVDVQQLAGIYVLTRGAGPGGESYIAASPTYQGRSLAGTTYLDAGIERPLYTISPSSFITGNPLNPFNAIGANDSPSFVWPVSFTGTTPRYPAGFAGVLRLQSVQSVDLFTLDVAAKLVGQDFDNYWSEAFTLWQANLSGSVQAGGGWQWSPWAGVWPTGGWTRQTGPDKLNISGTLANTAARNHGWAFSVLPSPPQG